MTGNLEERINSLENWKTQVAVSIGKQEVDKEYINKKFERIEEELEGIKRTARNLNITVYAAIITYFVKLALSGGFAQGAVSIL